MFRQRFLQLLRPQYTSLDGVPVHGVSVSNSGERAATKFDGESVPPFLESRESRESEEACSNTMVVHSVERRLDNYRTGYGKRFNGAREHRVPVAGSKPASSEDNAEGTSNRVHAVARYGPGNNYNQLLFARTTSAGPLVFPSREAASSYFTRHRLDAGNLRVQETVEVLQRRTGPGRVHLHSCEFIVGRGRNSVVVAVQQEHPAAKSCHVGRHPERCPVDFDIFGSVYSGCPIDHSLFDNPKHRTRSAHSTIRLSVHARRGSRHYTSVHIVIENVCQTVSSTDHRSIPVSSTNYKQHLDPHVRSLPISLISVLFSLSPCRCATRLDHSFTLKLRSNKQKLNSLRIAYSVKWSNHLQYIVLYFIHLRKCI